MRVSMNVAIAMLIASSYAAQAGTPCDTLIAKISKELTWPIK